mmetsp:Transcript_8709/g.24555  ORF Transcript_8709/g.24555 Transcript_8709/m.24555 type:complete len:205 (-) Transcript_8709:469-1083(-)
MSLANLAAASFVLVSIASVDPSVDLILEAVLEPDPVYSMRSNSSISSVDEIVALLLILEFSSTAVLDWDITLRLALAMALRLLAHVVASLLLLSLLLDEVLECTDSSVGEASASSTPSFESIHLPPSEGSEDDENDPADPFQEESGSVPSVLIDLLLSLAWSFFSSRSRNTSWISRESSLGMERLAGAIFRGARLDSVSGGFPA